MIGLLGNDIVNDEDIGVPPIPRLDVLTARRIARQCVQTWLQASPDLDVPYSIPPDRRKLAMCSEPDSMDLIDIDDMPKRQDYDSVDEYMRDARDYATKLCKAKEMCETCPLRDECRAASMMAKKFLRKGFSIDNATPESFGVWGGLSPADRKFAFPFVIQAAQDALGRQVNDSCAR